VRGDGRSQDYCPAVLLTKQYSSPLDFPIMSVIRFIDNFSAFDCWDECYLKIQFLPQRKHFSITKINWLMLFKEIIAVYSENHTIPVNVVCGKMQSYRLLKQVSHVVTTGI
jgi:hypothetical protein